MGNLLLEILSLLAVGLIPAVLLIGILAAVPAGWLMSSVIFRRAPKNNYVQNNSNPTV